jgi:chromosomal replication initiator protein
MDYTFTNFAVGPSNQFAHAAAVAVARAPAASYNPLFLYGSTGVGKTHLLHAIMQYITQHHPTWHVVSLPAEHFMRELLHALHHEQMPAFQQHYRRADALLLDDVHLLAGRPQTQEVFLHVFDVLYAAKKQIVVTSAQGPQELVPLATRLRSRLSAGLVALLQPPDLETRLAILNQKAVEHGFHLPLEVALGIAQYVGEHGDALEQCLTRIAVYASLHARPLDSALAEEVLEQASSEQKRAVTIGRIQQVVAAHYGVKSGELRGQQRQRVLAVSRQIAMFLCRELTQASLKEIGRHFGGRSYTTVLHACTKVAQLAETDDSVASVLQHVRHRLQA